MAREVIRRLGRPVAAPSANRFGRVSPTTAQHVADDLGDDVDVILDGGPCDIGVESTVVDCTTDPVQLLRPGSLSATDIEGLLATSVAEASGPIRAPGMLEVHYAPACRVFVAEDDADVDLISGQLAAAALSVDVLDLRRDAVAAARGLYGWLRDADRRGVTHLIVIPPAAAGLGIAVRDRLTRAAAGRSAH
jgi:L-threonylcarbamoyladenylate synthase